MMEAISLGSLTLEIISSARPMKVHRYVKTALGIFDLMKQAEPNVKFDEIDPVPLHATHTTKLHNYR